MSVPVGALAGLIKGNLKKKDVTSIRFDRTSYAVCPGVRDSFEVEATTSDGKVYSTKGDITWGSYLLSSDLGALNDKGKFSLPADPRQTWGRTGKIEAIAEDHPDKRATAELVPTYSCPSLYEVAGPQGGSGGMGAGGAQGSASSGSKGAGAGGPGGAGQTGGNGGPGPSVSVWVTLVKDPRSGEPVLQARVQGPGGDAWYALSPEAGQLTVHVIGGTGGTGGAGGKGGTGGIGYSEMPGGAGGAGGSGGAGGAGGPGGTVTVTVDPAAKPYLSRFTFLSSGGPGGNGGARGEGGAGGSGSGAPGADGAIGPLGAPGSAGPAPVITVAPVPPLW